MQIDVFHDTACPWCRIGKRHLTLALDGWEGEPVDVRYRSFFLNPSIPAEGVDFRSYMQAKGGGRIPLQQFFDGPRQAGAAVGLTFNFEAMDRAPNTLLSHRLIALAPPEKRQAVLTAVYDAYFEHGRDIGDMDVLVDVAVGQGLDAAETRRLLLSDAARDAVLADAAWAQQHGISGVPFFIVDGRYAFSGAQPPEQIRRVLAQAGGLESGT